jgi:Arc/MetJ-type ribon-helix-helix transcriptional regulator
MNVHVSEHTEEVIRSYVHSGRFPSEEAVIEEAVRRLESESLPQPATDSSIAAFQELQRKLFAVGLISEIRPAARVDTGTERFTPIVIEGEPLSETVIRERR